MAPRFLNAFCCSDLENSKKWNAMEAYLLGEEDLGGISSLLYRSPVQKDVIVLGAVKRN